MLRLSVIRNIQTLTSINFMRRINFCNPIFNSQAIVYQDIGRINSLYLIYCWLKIMWFDPCWNQDDDCIISPPIFLTNSSIGKKDDTTLNLCEELVVGFRFIN